MEGYERGRKKSHESQGTAPFTAPFIVFGSLRETVFKIVMSNIFASEFGEKLAKIAKRSRVKVRPGRQYSQIGLKKEKHVFRRVC